MSRQQVAMLGVREPPPTPIPESESPLHHAQSWLAHSPHPSGQTTRTLSTLGALLPPN